MKSGAGDVEAPGYDVYFQETEDSIMKMNDQDGSVTWNGFHITYGDLKSYFTRLLIKVPEEGENYLYTSDDFTISVTEELINIFPNKDNITEYYICDCRSLHKQSV